MSSCFCGFSFTTTHVDSDGAMHVVIGSVLLYLIKTGYSRKLDSRPLSAEYAFADKLSNALLL